VAAIRSPWARVIVMVPRGDEVTRPGPWDQSTVPPVAGRAASATAGSGFGPVSENPPEPLATNRQLTRRGAAYRGPDWNPDSGGADGRAPAARAIGTRREPAQDIPHPG